MDNERNQFPEGMIFTMDKKKKEKTKSTLSSMQEVLYAHEFRKADRAAGLGTSGKRGGNI